MKLTADAILSAYGAPEREFSIFLDGGEEFKFKALQSIDDIREITKEGQKWFKMLHSNRVTPQLKAVRPSHQETALWIYFLATTCIGVRAKPEDEFESWSQTDWCKVAKSAGFVIQFLFNEANKRQTAVGAQAEQEELDELGEESGETSSGETA